MEKYILIAVLIFAVIVTASIGTSVLFGGSINQFSFTEDFSFSIGGTSAFLTILLASCIEELGWRSYGEDAVGAYNSWFKESIIFGCIWSLWHVPLFWIPGTYQYGLKEMGIMYVINFLLSVIPLELNFINVKKSTIRDLEEILIYEKRNKSINR
jgi:membrane protease YdiL (CAAX protease family)